MLRCSRAEKLGWIKIHEGIGVEQKAVGDAHPAGLHMKKKKETFIRIDYLPYKHAEKAYSDGYFIEAIQVIHGCIERQLRELIFAQGTHRPHENFDLAIDFMFEVPFNIAVKILFIQKAISKKLRDRLVDFNKARNGIIHKIYFDNSSGSWQGFPKSQYDRAYKDGLELITILEDMVHAPNLT